MGPLKSLKSFPLLVFVLGGHRDPAQLDPQLAEPTFSLPIYPQFPSVGELQRYIPGY